MFKYKRLDKDFSIIQYQGIFRKQIGLLEGVALIVAGTLGAGILGLPYAVSKVGSLLGIVYIFVLGFLMIGFNLLLGEVAVRTRGEFQLVGLAKKYLGPAGKWLMTLLVYLISFGVLNIYIIGEGQSLSALFGGSPLVWSLLFWAAGSFFIYLGLRLVKVLDFFISLLIFLAVLVISVLAAPHIEIVNLSYSQPVYFLFPFGVVLFAFAGSGAVLEAHTLLKGEKLAFKKAIMVAGLILMAIYTIFTLVVLGITGLATTEIATIGLSEKIGAAMLIVGNLFAALLLGSSFLNQGLFFRDSLHWDYKLPRWLATAVVCGVPLLIFLLGMRSFILMIDIVGGVFLTTEMLLVILIYWKAKRLGDLPAGRYKLHNVYLLAALLVLALAVGGVYSVVKMF